ncbi:hypothetical protein [Jeongeupia chitinilytica]|uniref:Uncharacterized protein n=1 Tax=Jeongeupia chitinilytica TaxID=1041641 RepID=A0ABQ3H084_9NEIS|nr:hypothetical protein [Jeongeupia chitinilytica]GHD59401.1 hypothetical protein GCM10007350_10820 [Jeongeupia chitinilytica]
MKKLLTLAAFGGLLSLSQLASADAMPNQFDGSRANFSGGTTVAQSGYAADRSAPQDRLEWLHKQAGPGSAAG